MQQLSNDLKCRFTFGIRTINCNVRTATRPPFRIPPAPLFALGTVASGNAAQLRPIASLVRRHWPNSYRADASTVGNPRQDRRASQEPRAKMASRNLYDDLVGVDEELDSSSGCDMSFENAAQSPTAPPMGPRKLLFEEDDEEDGEEERQQVGGTNERRFRDGMNK